MKAFDASAALREDSAVKPRVKIYMRIISFNILAPSILRHMDYWSRIDTMSTAEHVLVGIEVFMWITALINLIICERRKTYEVGVRNGIWLFFLCMAAISYTKGSMSSMALFWVIIMAPLANQMVGSKKQDIAMVIISCFVVITLYYGYTHGLLPPEFDAPPRMRAANYLAAIAIIYYVGSFSIEWQRNVSKQYVDELRASNSEAVRRGKFLVNLNHELRNPLTALLSAAEAINKDNDPKLNEDLVRTIQTTSEHLLTVVNEVLENEKLASGAVRPVKAPFSVSQCIDEVITIQTLRTTAGNITIEKDTDGCFDLWVGDENKLRRVLINLVSNAIKHGGGVDVRIVAKQVVDGLKVTVSDGGPGVSERKLANLFEPFVDSSVQVGSSGLGLPICRRLVEEVMGGKLEVRSRPGLTEFSVRVPFTRVGAEPEPVAVPAIAASRAAAPVDETSGITSIKGIGILLVEDDKSIRDVLGTLFSQAGAGIEMASSVSEALDLLQKKTFQCIVVDRNLGSAEDGVDLTRKIASIPSQGIILGFSGNCTDELIREWREAGASGVVMKPANFGRLTAAILSHMNDLKGRRMAPA